MPNEPNILDLMIERDDANAAALAAYNVASTTRAAADVANAELLRANDRANDAQTALGKAASDQGVFVRHA
jgi:hypothetical protein